MLRSEHQATKFLVKSSSFFRRGNKKAGNLVAGGFFAIRLIAFLQSLTEFAYITAAISLSRFNAK